MDFRKSSRKNDRRKMKSVAVFLENKHKNCYNINHKISNAIVSCFNELKFKAEEVTNVQVLNSRKFDIIFSIAPSHESSFVKKKGTIHIMYQGEQLPQRDLTTHRASLCWQRFMQDIRRYDFIFDPYKNNAEMLSSRGYRALHFQLGYHKSLDYTQRFKENVKYDIAFVGNLESENYRRKYILENLVSFCKKHKISHHLIPVVVGDDYLKVMYSCKIFLNIHHTYVQYFEAQKVVTDSLCNSRFLLTEPFGCDVIYKNDRHIAIRHITKFQEAIEFYLAHPDERQRVARCGYNFVQKYLLVNSLKGTLKQIGIR